MDNNRFIRYFSKNRNVVPRIKVILMFIGLIFVTLVFIESLLTFIINIKEQQITEDYEFRYNPYTAFSSTLRDTKNHCENHNENIEIHVYGGSTTWGSRTEYNETYSSYLSKILCDKGFNVNIKNYGQLSYTNTQEFIKFILGVKNGNVPNIVIFYDGVNDMPSEPGLQFEQKTKDVVRDILDNSRFLPSVHRLLSNFFKTIGFKEKSEIDKHTNYFQIFDRHKLQYNSEDEKQLLIVSNYINNVEFIKSLEKIYNFTSLFYWQPHLGTKQTYSEEEEKSLNMKYIKRDLESYEKSYNLTINIIREHKYVSDLTNLFDNVSETIYHDDCHKNIIGNQILAQRMARDIIAIINNASE